MDSRVRVPTLAQRDFFQGSAFAARRTATTISTTSRNDINGGGLSFQSPTIYVACLVCDGGELSKQDGVDFSPMSESL